MKSLIPIAKVDRPFGGDGGEPTSLPARVSAQTLWESVIGEPGTGVWVVSLDGLILFANDQAAVMFNGTGTRGTNLMGKNITELYSPDWVRERLAVLRQVLLQGKPVLVRAIWRGWQQTSWITYIEGGPADEPDPPELNGRPAPARFFVITRRAPSDAETTADESRYQFIESQEIDLGPIDVLTTRELEVLSLVGQGLSTKEIARCLFRSVKTVDKHRTTIMDKLAAHDRLKLARIASRAGLTLRDAGKSRT